MRRAGIDYSGLMTTATEYTSPFSREGVLRDVPFTSLMNIRDSFARLSARATLDGDPVLAARYAADMVAYEDEMEVRTHI